MNSLIKLLTKWYINLGFLRAHFWRLLGYKIGKHTNIGSSVLLSNALKLKIGSYCKITSGTRIEPGTSSNGITIGNHVDISRNCWVVGSGDIIIKNYVRFAPNVAVISSNHNYSDIEKRIADQGAVSEPITIEEDCWLGINVVVTAGVTIGRGSVVGANAVVTKNVKPYSVVGGVPAKLIKYRG